MFFFKFADTLNKMAKNDKIMDAITRTILEISQVNLKKNEEIENLLLEQKNNNKNINSYLMAKIPDMNEFFPLKDDNQLNRFLDNSDGLYPLRRAEFYNMLYNIRTEKKNQFGTAILKTFFSMEYIKTHKWPCNK